MSRKPKDEANTSDVSASSRPSGWQPIDHKPLIKRLKAAKKWAQLQAMELGLVRIQGKACRECEATAGRPHEETCPALHAQRHANTIQEAIRALALPPGSDPPAPAPEIDPFVPVIGPHEDGWICETHPEREWPHEDCAGPGMPVGTRINALVYQRDQARQEIARLTHQLDVARATISIYLCRAEQAEADVTRLTSERDEWKANCIESSRVGSREHAAREAAESAIA